MVGLSTLSGTELITVQGATSTGLPSGGNFNTTANNIAYLALTGFNLNPITNTNVTTVGNGTLPALGLVTGYITRSGPTANFTDTTGTAADIYAALQPTVVAGVTAGTQGIINRTAFTMTITGGTGVTISGPGGGNVIPPLSGAFYLINIVSATAVTMYQVSINQNIVTPSTITPLNTVGAGTITAAGIVGGITSRGGAQLSASFTDTTDTANNIISTIPNAGIGANLAYIYQNSTNAIATLAGGSGVTVSVITTIPPNSWSEYLVTYTAASTVTMAGYEQGFYPSIGTFTVTGATPVTVSNSAVTTASIISISLKNVGGTVGAVPVIKTITAGVGFTVTAITADVSVYNYKIEG